MNEDCQVYTSLFNIGRDKIDGRSIFQYQDWLRKTLDIFPDMLIFHDGSCAEMEIPNQNLKFLDKANLRAFSFQKQLVDTLKIFNPSASKDITFRLPEYSLVQFSKFELGIMASEFKSAQSVLWVDAGISRFLDSHLKSKTQTYLKFRQQTNKLNKFPINMVLELDILNNLSLKELRLSKSDVGSCRRVISGTSFWIKSNYLLELNELIFDEIANWLNLKIWDNEQVLLRKILPKLSRLKFVPQFFEETGGVAREMLNNKISKPNQTDRLITGALR
jgi:hypothetical protein